MTVDVGVPASVVGGDVAGTPTPPSWTVHGDIEQIAAPWVSALGELKEVTKSKKVEAGPIKYSYAELGDVLSHARGVLKAHDLALFQVATIDDGEIAVATTVMHTSGAYLQFAQFHLPAGPTAQNVGSSCTYARRYSLMSILGLGTDDDDGATAGTRTEKESPPELMPMGHVTRFVEAARDALLTAEETAQVVNVATGGRTDDPAQVWNSEVEALRDALHAAAHNDTGVSQVDGADDQIRPASSESGEGEAGSSDPADPSPDQPLPLEADDA